MARRLFLGLLLSGAAASSIAGCEDRWGYYGYGYGHYRPYICNQYSSCGSCTPVAGCGWCSFPGGGACLSSPDECTVTAFSWTWESSGCGSAGDAGTPSKPAADAGTPSKPDSAPPPDASSRD